MTISSEHIPIDRRIAAEATPTGIVSLALCPQLWERLQPRGKVVKDRTKYAVSQAHKKLAMTAVARAALLAMR